MTRLSLNPKDIAQTIQNPILKSPLINTALVPLIASWGTRASTHNLWSRSRISGTSILALSMDELNLVGSYKINIDGALMEGAMVGAISGVLRDVSETLVDNFAKTIPTSSTIQTEHLALIEALKFFDRRERVRWSLNLIVWRWWMLFCKISTCNGRCCL